MKIIVTIILTDLVTNSVLIHVLFFLRNRKSDSHFQQVGGLVTGSISVLSISRVALYFKAMSNSTEFYSREFSSMLSLFDFYSSMDILTGIMHKTHLFSSTLIL